MQYSVSIFNCCFFFNCRALCWSICVWILNVGSCSDLYTVLLFCLYFLAILVCNFACDLCCIFGKKLCRAYVVLFYYVPNQNKVFLSYLTCNDCYISNGYYRSTCTCHNHRRSWHRISTPFSTFCLHTGIYFQ